MSIDDVARGGGNYDAVSEWAFRVTRAHALVLIVFGGSHGSSYETCTTDPNFEKQLPAQLRKIADEIEAITKARGG